METQENNIDDLLSAELSPVNTPEKQAESSPDEEHANLESSSEDTYEVEGADREVAEDVETSASDEEESLDEYGNVKAPPKTYSEEEVNEKINKAVRERLARAERSHEQPSPPSGHDPALNNDASDGQWEQQLSKFVEDTVSNMNHKQQQQQVQQREHEAQKTFEDKFHNGMSKFGDFVNVVSAQPVTDSMTMSLRGMKDPASFLYAASKRHSEELHTISKLVDPYAQMTAMGRLEERMRKSPASTKAPRPLSRTQGDASMPHKSKSSRPLSIDDQLAQSDTKRLSLRRARVSR